MEIKGTVHCLFEQSGVFKNEFIKLGIPAIDYDIQDNFGEVGQKLDLFVKINNAFDNLPSVFDTFLPDDLYIVRKGLLCLLFMRATLFTILFSAVLKNIVSFRCFS